MTTSVSHWAAERRRDYIDFRMLTAGSINRSDLVMAFGISTPQASKDINTFLALYPGSLNYDKTAKRYVPRKGYKSVRGMTPTVLRLIEAMAATRHPMAWQ